MRVDRWVENLAALWVVWKGIPLAGMKENTWVACSVEHMVLSLVEQLVALRAGLKGAVKVVWMV